jgi:hypothetical protein
MASISIGSVDLRGLRARVDVEDGDIVILVDDGDIRMSFVPGAGGSRAQAILGAERLASVAREYAEALRNEVLQLDHARAQRLARRQVEAG